MLHLWHNQRTHETRLYIRGVHCEAWISEAPYSAGTDWVLWVRQPHSPATPEKGPTQIEIVSRLRTWLLRRYRRRLFELSFRELCTIAGDEQTKHGTTHTRRARYR